MSSGESDTSVETVSSPPPTTGTTYFLAGAETPGSIYPWTYNTGAVTNPPASSSADRAKNGSRSWKFERTDITHAGQWVQFLGGAPQVSMGSTNGRFTSGWYSFYVYIDAGYNEPGWNMLLGWMTGVSGKPSPIDDIELMQWNGVLQLAYRSKVAEVGCYTLPSQPGYQVASDNWVFMTPSSPAGVKAFPRQQWVHVAIYHNMARNPNGQLQIWQDGVKIMDLTRLNTFDGHSWTPCTNATSDMMLQFGIYSGPRSTVQRLYVDDFRVSDNRPLP